MSARTIATSIVERWLQSGDFPDRLLEQVQEHRPWVTEAVLGVVRRRRTLDWVCGNLVDRNVDKPARAILLTALYQLFYMKAGEEYAVVNETVELAKVQMGRRGASFTNAVLRRALRERRQLLERLTRESDGLRFSHPDDLVSRWGRSFDSSCATNLCRWNNRRPQVVLTVCLSRTTLDDYRSSLKAEGIEAVPHPYAPSRCLVLPRGIRIPKLPGYEGGLFFVQDPSGIEAVGLLAPQPGEDILDACAAPGGKTMLIADRIEDRGAVLATDVHADRLERLQSNADRMGWSCVTVAQADARSESSLMDATQGRLFDGVLLDVPCTNTGVIRRRPDVRWRFTERRLGQQVRTQRTLLQSASGKVKPGGRMVYSTCSLEPEEGEGLVHDWLKGAGAFRLVKEHRLVPPVTGTDGAYAALLTRHRA